MSKKWLTIILIFFLAGLLSIPFLAVFKSQDLHAQTKTEQKKKPSRESFPTVDFSGSPFRGKALERSEKYDRAATVLSTDLTKDVDSESYFDYQNFAPLPIDESDLIVVGKVTEVAGVLSPRRTAVFTQTTIKVESVLKGGHDNSAQLSTLVVEREGGVVKYPSGAKLWHHVGAQEMPIAGHTYYFFLSNQFPRLGKQPNDLYLLTAYEVNEDRIFPLDDALIFLRYSGKPEIEFRTELLNSIAAKGGVK